MQNDLGSTESLGAGIQRSIILTSTRSTTENDGSFQQREISPTTQNYPNTAGGVPSIGQQHTIVEPVRDSATAEMYDLTGLRSVEVVEAASTTMGVQSFIPGRVNNNRSFGNNDNAGDR